MAINQNYRNQIRSSIKTFNLERFNELIINCNHNDLSYELIMMTAECEKNLELMALLGKWRKENEEWFPAQFNVTLEGTCKWFINGVIGTEDRLLFLIKVADEYIGHVGLFRFNFEKKTCEIDNILRGVSKYPGIMESAIHHMMNWGKDTLGLKGYTLQTSSDNERALTLYKKMGFVEIQKEPLIKKCFADRNEWVIAPPNYDKKIERYNLIMVQKDSNE